MKIVKEGHIPMPPPLWPIGFGFECYHCHCQFEFEEGDTVNQNTERRPHGKSTVTLPCPCCEMSLQAERPFITNRNVGRHSFAATTPEPTKFVS